MPRSRSHEDASMKVAVVKEAAPDERRVALVPEAVAKLRAADLEVLVESGAGDRAWLADGAYAKAGATIVAAAEVAGADAILMVGQPSEQLIARLRPGQAVFGLLAPLADPALAARLAAAGVTAVSLDLIPRTLPRAQPMDALSSQANIAGYKAAVLAAATFGRFFPLLITAAGTARPARVLVLGTGVAGLQAIGTARRLGAVVTAYDVRPETKTEVESLGATFLELAAVGPAAGDGGYARALTEDERHAQQDELTGETVTTEHGITVIGAGSLPSTMPAAASAMYARNISALLLYMMKDGKLAIDLSDELQAGVVISRDGSVIHPALAAAGADEPVQADTAGGAPRVDGTAD